MGINYLLAKVKAVDEPAGSAVRVIAAYACHNVKHNAILLLSAFSSEFFLPLRAIAMERYCHRMASVRPSVCLSVCLSVTLVSADHIICWAT